MTENTAWNPWLGCEVIDMRQRDEDGAIFATEVVDAIGTDPESVSLRVSHSGRRPEGS